MLTQLFGNPISLPMFNHSIVSKFIPEQQCCCVPLRTRLTVITQLHKYAYKSKVILLLTSANDYTLYTAYSWIYQSYTVQSTF